MAVAVYHRIMRREGFEVTAKVLVELTKDAQKANPNEPRALYLDIDDHRDADGVFDADMLELQTEFILHFLLPFYTEVHVPLFSAENPESQDNDVPEKFSIVNLEKQMDETLSSLYLEDYGNTEFVSEEPVFDFLKRVSAFLDNVHSIHPMYKKKNEGTHTLEWRYFWHGYTVDLVTELFNSFVIGNLISVAAMTRSLIESYAYMAVFERSQDPDLSLRWFICSCVRATRRMGETEKGELLDSVKEYCSGTCLQYEEAVRGFLKGNENAWLSGVIDKKHISFRDVCDYLEDDYLYEDFADVCSYVHGQDMVTKLSPFTLYVSIYSKLYIVVTYSFRALALLFPLDEELKRDMEELETALIDLGGSYILKDREGRIA